jgi:hypothetical protein
MSGNLKVSFYLKKNETMQSFNKQQITIVVGR